MGPPEDEALLRDMLDHARRAVAAVSGKKRADLDSDFILAAALERVDDAWGRLFDPRTAAPRPPDQHDVIRGDAGAELIAARAGRRTRQACRAFDHRDAAVPQRVRLRTRPQACHALIHDRAQGHELRPNGGFCINHVAGSRSHLDRLVDLPFRGATSRSPSRVVEQLVSARVLSAWRGPPGAPRYRAATGHRACSETSSAGCSSRRSIRPPRAGPACTGRRGRSTSPPR